MQQQEFLAAFFSKKSAAAHALKNYEFRESQLKMASMVFEAFSQQKIALIEAGTGTGKSLAYLIPALLWAKKHGEKIVISTNTIALQEQLIDKDIPLALQIVGCSAKVFLAKGMSNYLCLQKLQGVVTAPSLFEINNHNELTQIDKWSLTTSNGTKSELPFFPSSDLWGKIAADSDSCSSRKCPFFQNCFFFKSKKELQEAEIIIVNHHLLFSDLSQRILKNNFNKPAVLPAYDRIIIDEAHHIEDVATEHLAERILFLEIKKMLSKLATEHISPMNILRKELLEPSVREIIDHKITPERLNLHSKIDTLFEEITIFGMLIAQRAENGSRKLRITNKERSHDSWKEKISPTIAAIIESFYNMASYLFSIHTALLVNDRIQEKLAVELTELANIEKRFRLQAETLIKIDAQELSDQYVRWIEIGEKNIELVVAQHDIAKHLGRYLFGPMKTAILSSATLACGTSMEFAKDRLGLSENPRTATAIFPSPFDYKKQALFCIPQNIPKPDSIEFIQELPKILHTLLLPSNGHALVLFTSYNLLNTIYAKLSPLFDKKFTLLRQGQHHKHVLLDIFKKTPQSILLATTSFWEGIDIVGDALRSVIITKLPFEVPTEPLYQARSESLQKQGKSPFFHYSVPKAVVKFKQAFGRLIRHRDDRGSIVCLDRRIVDSNYGRLFIKSLPECRMHIGTLESVEKELVAAHRSNFSEKWSVTGSNR